MKRFTVDYENNAETFWNAFHAKQANAPIRQLRELKLGSFGFVATDREAEQAERWLKNLPGYETSPFVINPEPSAAH